MLPAIGGTKVRNNMISAATLKQLTTLGPYALAQLLAQNKFSGQSFAKSEFLGMTNANEFCYTVTHHDDGGGPEEGPATSKVFVRYEPSINKVSASF